MTSSHHAVSPPTRQLFVLSFAPGPTWKPGVPMKEQGLSAHLERIRSAGEDGSVVVAGPYADESGGMALLFADCESEASAFVERDLAVVAGTMICKITRLLPVVGAELGKTREPSSALEIVRRLYEAVPRRDMSAADLYAEDVVIHEAASLPYGGDYAGSDGVLRHAQRYLEHWDRLQEPAERQLDPVYFQSRDQVVVLWRQRGRDGDRTFDMPAVSVYRLENDRITESRMFHFDAAAVAAFLAAAADGSSVVARDAALNRRLQEGGFATALEDFFDDDAELAEVDQPATAGKGANVVRERGFLTALERIEATLLSSAVQGEVSFSEWRYDIAFKSGRTLSYKQTARRQWRAGRVVREDFFHADFPAWFAQEMEAAVEKAK